MTTEEPITQAIVIHPHLLRKFMRYEKDFANLLALYSFYLYHAQLQKTNQILATNDFVHHKLHWAIERIKRIKRILKELKVIDVLQKGVYYYVKLNFIYTKKKVMEILDSTISASKKLIKQVIAKKPTPPKTKTKTIFEKVLEEKSVSPQKIARIQTDIAEIFSNQPYKVNPLAFGKWIGFCEKKKIAYNQNHLKSWLKSLHNRTSIEQLESINLAIQKGWKSFYIPSIQKSKYQKFLGRSLQMERPCKNLLDIRTKADKFVYVFENVTITVNQPVEVLFGRFG